MKEKLWQTDRFDYEKNLSYKELNNITGAGNMEKAVQLKPVLRQNHH